MANKRVTMQDIADACGLSRNTVSKVFNGRGAKACFVYMLGCVIASFWFWRLDSESIVLNILLLSLIGFFIYGPQCLIGCVASTIATKKSGAASSGLTGLFGYLATIVTGFGVGYLVDGATAPAKAQRDVDMAVIVAEKFESVDDDALLSDPPKLSALVKSCEAYYDAVRSLENFKGKENSEKYEEIHEKFVTKADKLTSCLADVTGESPDVLTSEARAADISDIVKKAADGRSEISKAGWPFIFGMLVFSSLAALLLFLAIFNTASPEVIAEEKRRKEEAAAKNA